MKSTNERLAEQCDSIAGLLKAIAHPQRLKILCRLTEGECTVTELEKYCGASQSSVSQYLGKMKAEGLLKARRDGKQMFYAIGDEDLSKMMKAMQKIFCP
jgi:DNA-binding transcriptional ArsR family regulator